MKTVCPRFGIICLYIICALSLLVSCGSLEEQLGGSITLEASPTSIPADGYSSSEITATVNDSSGTAVYDGTTVTFTTDLGSFSRSFSRSASVSVTTSGGKAVVSLIAGTTLGTATVTAEANNISQSITVPITDTTPGETASITLTADPTSIPADGSDSIITATLKDSSDDPVSPGTSVTFTTDLGSFPGGSTTYSTWTPDTSGEVAVSLSSGTTPGTATVTAKSNNISQYITVPFTDTTPGETASITLTANPTSIPADGYSSSTITAELKDSSDDPVSPGTSVTFTTDLGSFSGGSTTYSTWTSDDTGVVTVSLIAGTTSGTATVTAKSNNVTQAVTVTFTAP